MADQDQALTSVVAPDGREIALVAVMATVEHPDHVEPDVLPRRTRFYRRTSAPSRWLMVVVSYEQEPARIITALANRKDPKQWKP
jgi:hypothetical protein